MGPTGAGKSTFINSLIGQQRMTVGTTLKSQTSDLADALLDMRRYPGTFGGKYQIVVVDTPGFDDTAKSDVLILKKIAEWLEKSYMKDGAILGGVIYLHDVSLDRFTGTAQRNLDMFQALCGQGALSKVILGTTKWGRISDRRAQAHEDELKRDHWKTLIAEGAKVRSFKHRNDTESAWRFIDIVVALVKKEDLNEVYLQIQRELGDEKKLIPETDAGKALRATLKEILDMEKQVAGLERNMAEGGDDRAQAKLLEAEEQINRLLKQIDDLKVPLSRRFQRFISRFKFQVRCWQVVGENA
ncbi:P-loop containing nucleoside triphosphate hydrolase protein [Gymnopilus junonius]|uniref:P-loop containing nucleoside triphosphate hydrolase protein n=1 Tax=Gymnopilus junonius TaxID=109634 RepID=A0A9P5TI93_GYMJU|nr:P-loop containing nucleoside triphosphate hydrolase protein [Gymnopilus junonius]